MTATHGVNVFVVVVLSGGLLVSASETTTCVDPLGNAIGGTTGASYPDDCAGHNCSLSFYAPCGATSLPVIAFEQSRQTEVGTQGFIFEQTQSLQRIGDVYSWTMTERHQYVVNRGGAQAVIASTEATNIAGDNTVTFFVPPRAEYRHVTSPLASGSGTDPRFGVKLIPQEANQLDLTSTNLWWATHDNPTAVMHMRDKKITIRYMSGTGYVSPIHWSSGAQYDQVLDNMNQGWWRITVDVTNLQVTYWKLSDPDGTEPDLTASGQSVQSLDAGWNRPPSQKFVQLAQYTLPAEFAAGKFFDSNTAFRLVMGGIGDNHRAVFSWQSGIVPPTTVMPACQQTCGSAAYLTTGSGQAISAWETFSDMCAAGFDQTGSNYNAGEEIVECTFTDGGRDGGADPLTQMTGIYTSEQACAAAVKTIHVTANGAVHSSITKECYAVFGMTGVNTANSEDRTCFLQASFVDQDVVVRRAHDIEYHAAACSGACEQCGWVHPPSPPPVPPPWPPYSPGATSWSQGDPHLHFAEGGVADFRGRNNTIYALLSAPGVQFAARTLDASFLLPRPQLVHGSFFSEVAFVVRGSDGAVYGVMSNATSVSFEVYSLTYGKDAEDGADVGADLLESRVGVWKQWWKADIRVYYKQSTLYVRANGWEMNATRHPVYLPVEGARWRYDLAIRKLDKTAFSKQHGRSSATCFPHGLIGQSWDGDGTAVDGRVDDYKFSKEHPVVRTESMAEGAIEGSADLYELNEPFATDFAFDRFTRNATDVCAVRDVASLTGKKRKRVDRAGASDDDDGLSYTSDDDA